jgi:RNA polymerase primary sigma factor
MTTTAAKAATKRKNVNIDREALKRRTREVLSREVSFIPNSAFREMDDDDVWRKELATTEPRIAAPSPTQSGFKMPAHLERLCQTPLLTAEEERRLFRSMNYLKYRANALRSTLKENRPSVRKLYQIDALLEKAEAIRNEIVSANTRLIVSIVKKFADEKNTFDDMLSEGIGSMMKAAEKFDYDRGFRFSTYATMVVRREIYRTIQRSHRNRTRFVTGQAEVLDEQETFSPLVSPSEAQLQKVDDHVSKIMEHLDDREKLIVSARYGFIDLGVKATFSNLGQRLGISKERVRQLELRAVEKLRNVIGEMGIFNELRSMASQ